MDFPFKFANESQRDFYYATERNQLFSGGFNNGKTFSLCLKAATLLLTFNNYRMIIARQKYTDLKRTTMESFFKLLPPGLVKSHNQQDGITTLINDSLIWWIHLDKVDLGTLRGMEPNSVGTDQGEETEEAVYDVLDGRVGRWDGAIVPPQLLESSEDWPKYMNGNYVAPSYNLTVCNPDTEFHHLYRFYHPNSEERKANHFYCEGEWDKNLGSYETYEQAIKRDPEWVDKYVKGGWTSSSSTIHRLSKESILEYDSTLIDRIRTKARLYRTLDHGDSSPTCCLWWAVLDGIIICYREYYVGGKTISYHRRAIADLSGTEEYELDWCDPSMFNKTVAKEQGWSTLADEYTNSAYRAPPIFWTKADNNEFATRNKINELLTESSLYQHPITKVRPSPGIYFIRASSEYEYGCREAYRQLASQKKKLLGTFNGKSIYSDDRDDKVTDHAYDPTRYFVAMYGLPSLESGLEGRVPPRNTFAYFNHIKAMSKFRNILPASWGG